MGRPKEGLQHLHRYQAWLQGLPQLAKMQLEAQGGTSWGSGLPALLIFTHGHNKIVLWDAGPPLCAHG